MKHYILSIVALLSIFGLNAQEKQEKQGPKVHVRPSFSPMMEQNKFLSLSVGGGINTLMYDFPYGESELGKGGRFNIDYNIFFNKLCGISFGVGGAMFNSVINFNDNVEYTTSVNLPVTNAYGKKLYYNFDCTTTFTGWKETQSMLALEIPVGALFRVPIKENFTFLPGVGVKVYIPLKTSFEVTDGKTSTQIYNKNLNVTMDSVASHGIKTSDVHPSGSSETKRLSGSVYVDLNFVHRIGGIHLFYGLYGDYGLTNIATGNKALESIFDHNGVVSSDAVKKITPLSLGLRVGVKIPCPRLKDQDRDGVLDIHDNCPNTPAGLPVDTCG